MSANSPRLRDRERDDLAMAANEEDASAAWPVAVEEDADAAGPVAVDCWACGRRTAGPVAVEGNVGGTKIV